MTSLDAGSPATGSDEVSARLPRAAIVIRILAWFNVATVVLSVIAWSTGWQVGELLFPQASIFFPASWTGILRIGPVWFVFFGIGLLAALIGTARSPVGHRAYGAFRAATITGAVVAVAIAALVAGLGLIHVG